MNSILISLVCCLSGPAQALPLKEVVPSDPAQILVPAKKIQPGMTPKAVAALFDPISSGVRPQPGCWSGLTGYYDYWLGRRFRVSVVFATTPEGNQVHPALTLYLWDSKENRDAELVEGHWLWK